MLSKNDYKIFLLSFLFVIFPLFCFGQNVVGVIDFENGTDNAVVRSTIPGLHFTTTDGYDWIYGDWRTNNYNGPYPNGPYYSYGNFFAWLGPNQGMGRIDFTQGTGSYLTVWTSTYSGLTMDAYDSNGNWLANSGWVSNNLNTGTMNRLTVTAENISYVLIHDSGNYWLIDNLSTDTPSYKVLQVDALESIKIDDLDDINSNPETIWTANPYESKIVATSTTEGLSLRVTLDGVAPKVKCHVLFMTNAGVVFDPSSTPYEFSGRTGVITISPPPAVNRYSMLLTYYFYDSNDNLIDYETTRHVVYVTYGQPVSVHDGIKMEWLRKAVSWAVYDRNPQSIMEDINTSIYNCGWKYIDSGDPATVYGLLDDRSYTAKSYCAPFANVWEYLTKIHGIPTYRVTSTFNYGFITIEGDLIGTSPTYSQNDAFPYPPGDPDQCDRAYFSTHTIGYGDGDGDGTYYDPTYGALYNNPTEYVAWEGTTLFSDYGTDTNGNPILRQELTGGGYNLKKVYPLKNPSTRYEYHAGRASASGVDTTTAMEFSAARKPAAGNAAFTDGQAGGIDRDMDSQFEALMVTVGVSADLPGSYSLWGYVTAGDTFITQRENTNSVNPVISTIDAVRGESIAELQFSGEDILQSHLPGPYTITLYLLDADSIVVASTEIVSGAYQPEDFGEFPGKIRGAMESAVNTDADTAFEGVQVTADIAVFRPGSYSLSGALMSGTETVAIADVKAELPSGNSDLDLFFPGRDINKKGVSGPYTLRLTLEDAPHNYMNNYELTTGAYEYTSFESKAVLITGYFNDYGVDTDNDNRFDFLDLEVAMEVFEAGEYTLSAWLESTGPEPETMCYSRSTFAAIPGEQNTVLRFPGPAIYKRGIDGPYKVVRLVIHRIDGTVIDTFATGTITNAYTCTDFESPSTSFASLTGQYSDELYDTNGNGTSDYLIVSVQAVAQMAGNVVIEAGLRSQDGTLLTSTSGFKVVQANVATTIQLYFLGRDIYAADKNGPYVLTNVRVFHTDDQDRSEGLLDLYTTGNYNAIQFEPVGVVFGKVIQADGSGIRGAELMADRGMALTDGNGDYFMAVPVTGLVSLGIDPPLEYSDGPWSVSIDGGPSQPGDPVTIDVIKGTRIRVDFTLNGGSGGTGNNPPVLAPIGNKLVTAGGLLEFTIAATDTDGDTLTYSAQNLPAGALFNASKQEFRWTPALDQTGTYSVRFIVSDGNASDSEEITITVRDPGTSGGSFEDLINYILSIHLPHGIENSLISKIENAEKAHDNGHDNTAINILEALINEVEALSGKKIDSEYANEIIARAGQIILNL